MSPTCEHVLGPIRAADDEWYRDQRELLLCQTIFTCHLQSLPLPPFQLAHYQETGKGITPFLPSNSVPGGFRPMVSSQKVSHVPAEAFQQYEQQQESDQAEKYQFVSTTEK